MSQRTWNDVLMQWDRGHVTVYFCNGAEDMEQCTSAMGQRTWNSVLLQWDREHGTVYFCNETEDKKRCTFAMGQRMVTEANHAVDKHLFFTTETGAFYSFEQYIIQQKHIQFTSSAVTLCRWDSSCHSLALAT